MRHLQHSLAAFRHDIVRAEVLDDARAGVLGPVPAHTFGTIVRHQFYPTCDFLQIFHSKVQLAIQGLPFEFPGAPTCAEIRSEYECARVNAMAVGTAL